MTVNLQRKEQLEIIKNSIKGITCALFHKMLKKGLTDFIIAAWLFYKPSSIMDHCSLLEKIEFNIKNSIGNISGQSNMMSIFIPPLRLWESILTEKLRFL